MNVPAKLKVATMWLDGCSGCHMSLLDMDERLLEIAQHIDLVYSPLVDPKELPAEIDLAIVEGAVSSRDDLEKVRKLRAHSKFLLSLGDCAVTGNVPSMRNVYDLQPIFQRAYHETASLQPQDPHEGVPPLLERVQPVHAHVSVDLYVPGCPPPADAIYFVLSELIAGRKPQTSAVTRFGR